MPISTDLIDRRLSPTTFSWSESDAVLYALGVGARPPTELALLDEQYGPAVLPTFALIANWWAVKDLRSVLDAGTATIVHAHQSLTLNRPLKCAGAVDVQAWVSAVWDKGKHALVEVTSRGHDGDGELFTATSQTMVLGAGGFGGERGPAAGEEPDGPPTDVHDDVVRPEQAAIYRLSGDRNPLHIDPAAARAYGFDDVFLHGLCTLGFAARAIVNTYGKGDPATLTAISAQFAKPVVLDAGLRTELWANADGVRFRSSQGSTTVLRSGTATLAGG